MQDWHKLYFAPMTYDNDMSWWMCRCLCCRATHLSTWPPWTDTRPSSRCLCKSTVSQSRWQTYWNAPLRLCPVLLCWTNGGTLWAITGDQWEG